MARHFSKAGFAAQHPPGLPLHFTVSTHNIVVRMASVA